ncbi:MAG: HD domain-containing protein [Planctomycetes bacterium]|nr:HD domain-containing protein [Planctomycetota bacterium]
MRAEVLEYPRHRRLWPLVEARLQPGELAHDRWHLERVYAWAMRLAPEAGVDADLAGATALAHDLAVVPKESPERPQGGERSARLAGEPLAAAGYSTEEIAAIVEVVRTSSWSRGLSATSPLGELLQDADRLDAIGAVGIARVFACAQAMSRPERPGRFYDPLDPVAATPRPLDDRAQAVDHFAAKLLRLADGMHFPSARAEAQRRQFTLRAYLAALAYELAGAGMPGRGDLPAQQQQQ